jgi:hypothetical protein
MPTGIYTRPKSTFNRKEYDKLYRETHKIALRKAGKLYRKTHRTEIKAYKETLLILDSCPKCGRERKIDKRNKGRLCRFCSRKGKPGHPAWNKGTKGVVKGWSKGKKLSIEHRRNIGLSRKHIKYTQEWRDNISKSNKGKLRKDKVMTYWGYVCIYKPEHPYAYDNYVKEHRLILEKYLGRYLTSIETPHHINRIKNDNRLSNLILFVNNSAHIRFHSNPNKVKPEEIIFDGRSYICQ